MHNRRIGIIQAVTISLFLAALLASSGCSPELATEVSRQVERIFPSIVSPTPTPFRPVGPTPSPTISPTPTLAPTDTPEPVTELLVWLDPALPVKLREQIQFPPDTREVDTIDGSNLQIGAIRGGPPLQSFWVYALVVPFPTIRDEASLTEIQYAWRGEPGVDFTGRLRMSPSTRAAFEANWGPAGEGRLDILPDEEMVDAAWASRTDWAVVPFEQIEPRWKVLRVEGLSPLDKAFDIEKYPLMIWFGISGQPEAQRLFQERLGMDTALLPPGNRDPNKMTTLVMTGVTALARATGYKMDTLGTTYPGQDIQNWLRDADLTHISNEVSFNPRCPLADYFSTEMQFCSRPEYIELLEFIGADIIELSGNHVNDYDRPPFLYSLNMYDERGWLTYAGGADQEDSRQPAKTEHHGNKLAFIGCNPVGPPHAWATEELPGAAPCEDMEWMLETIRSLRSEGYLPIVTFQHYERYVHYPTPKQETDFRAVIDAGAIIASGSHAHYPHYMEIYNGAFIHYGLGNLFFDQMDIPVEGTRREFIDRHTIYDGRIIHTELLTALLEDYARPRPMTQEERETMLADIFGAAGW